MNITTKRVIIVLAVVGVVGGLLFGFQIFKGIMIAKFMNPGTLPPQTVSKAEPCDIWRVRGPPGELVPDLDDWGPELYPDTVDEVYEEDDMRGFFDDEPEPGLAA